MMADAATQMLSGLTRSFSRAFTALKYRNYRLWFIGQLVSLFGTWMQMTAQGFLVFELTKSPAQLGIVAFAGGAPSWVLMLYGGVVADRFPKRTLMLFTQVALMLIASVFALLTFTHLIRPWHITALALLGGIANAFDAPVRQSMVRDLVDTKDIVNAVALNSTMFNTASFVGPALAGFAYVAYGPGWCFLINAISFLAIIISLAMMDIAPFVGYGGPRNALIEVKEGLSYVMNNPLISSIIFFVAMFSFFGQSYVTLFPAWAHHLLSGDARTLGFLHSSRGIGCLMGALFVAFLGKIRDPLGVLLPAAVLFPLSLLAFAATSSLLLATPLLIVVGFTSIVILNLANSTIQTTVDDSLRGRIMAIYSLMMFGMMPLGGLMVGWLAELGSERFALIFCAFCMLITVMVFVIMIRRGRSAHARDNPDKVNSESIGSNVE